MSVITMHPQLLVACLLLVASGISDAKSTFKRHQILRQVTEQCEEGRVRCRNSDRCIPELWFCDGDNDCGDASDEPVSCRNRECPTGSLRCFSGQCLTIDEYCEGNNCRDGTILQTACPDITCEPGFSKCPYRTRCIQNSWFCDGDDDCRDGSDEANCAPRPVTPSSHQHNDDDDDDGNTDDAGAINCMRTVGPAIEQTCGRDPFNGMFEGMSEPMIYEKVLEIDLSEMCRPVLEWLSCAENAFEACAGINHPIVTESLRTVAMGKLTLDYICLEHVDVANDNKACLLRRVDSSSHTEQVELQLQHTTMTSCGHLMPMGPPPPESSSPVCLVSSELQECVKNLVAEQCGDEIAEVLNELGDRVRKIADCPQVVHHGGPHQGPPHKKRRGHKVAVERKWFVCGLTRNACL